MAYLFRLILLCVPLFGAVAATAEAPRSDRAMTVEEVAEVAAPAEHELVLAFNTATAPAAKSKPEVAAVAADNLLVNSEVMAGASAGLPLCLALVLLVTLVRQRI